ncbi:hypothetical protein PoB_001745300 [Plakobranchus ocellatus]|uniref:Uncharacterized protein n=1 Tax=Plakobranchus ocellatus TaxID=259542 RepID=A0AAV3Z875_9GAST|nr:hypothetical protein PoB_001745300 [Plakobranchus ocellatus]
MGASLPLPARQSNSLTETEEKANCDSNSRWRLSFQERWKHGHNFLICWVGKGPVLCDLCLLQIFRTWYMRCECDIMSFRPPSGQGFSGAARKCDDKFPADRRVGSLASVPPSPNSTCKDWKKKSYPTLSLR